MHNQEQLIIYLDTFVFFILIGFFVLLFKSKGLKKTIKKDLGS